MARHTIALIPGDGIGPEIVAATVRVLAAAGADIEWREVLAGVAALDAYKDPLPDATVETIRECGVALKGPLTTPVGSGFRSINVALRQEFDLFINLRPARSFAGVPSRYDGIDMVMFRENTEGLYSGVEHYIGRDRGAAEAVTIITRSGSERIARAAFEYAVRRGRRRVTIIHKANILKFTSGLFLNTAREVGKEFPSIECEEMIVDNAAMQFVLNPARFDLLVTTNLFGDILSDLASGLVGGLGLAPGANIGTSTAIFEPVHGSAPDIAGRGIANPCAEILAAVLMLEHLGEDALARRVEDAVRRVLIDGRALTPDLRPGSTATTGDLADAVISAL